MDILHPGQILTLLGFLGALGLVWHLVRRKGDALARPRRMQLRETMMLGPSDRAAILDLDGQEFLLLRLKGAQPLLHPLGPAKTGAPE